MADSVNSFPIKVVTANTRFHASEHEEESNLDDSDHACFISNCLLTSSGTGI